MEKKKKPTTTENLLLACGTFLNFMLFLDFAPGKEIYYFGYERLSSALAVTALQGHVLNWPMGSVSDIEDLVS